mmetsp:Transcript_20788/g.66327  ORF Transcript_20788/g.66327 Transcript_20788/m.66327 type:complete len:213 (-) Transcript_20788:470-1108(-)
MSRRLPPRFPTPRWTRRQEPLVWAIAAGVVWRLLCFAAVFALVDLSAIVALIALAGALVAAVVAVFAGAPFQEAACQLASHQAWQLPEGLEEPFPPVPAHQYLLLLPLLLHSPAGTRRAFPPCLLPPQVPVRLRRQPAVPLAVHLRYRWRPPQPLLPQQGRLPHQRLRLLGPPPAFRLRRAGQQPRQHPLECGTWRGLPTSSSLQGSGQAIP